MRFPGAHLILFCVFSSVLFLYSCNGSDKGQTGEADNETFESSPPLLKWLDRDSTARFIMRVNNECKQQPDSFRISDSLLWGAWHESLVWKKEDTCWYGLEPIDRERIYTFSPSHKFTITSLYSDSSRNDYSQGQFWTYTRGDSNFLELGISNGDTLFQHGDTFLSVHFQVYSAGEILRMTIMRNTGEYDPVITELLKK